MTADLVQFLRARYDEEVVEAGKLDDGDDWEMESWQVRRDETGTYDSYAYLRIAKARVLAEVTWRRIIVGNYAALLKTFGGVDWAKGKNDPVMSGTLAAMETLHSVLRAMATVYADHPDYREEWKL